MSYGPPADPPSPSPSPAATRLPLWVPLTAGLAVVAVVAVAFALVASRGDKSAAPTITAGSSSTAASTTMAGTTTTTALPEAGGSWTVLVYGLGDNNLEADLLNDLGEMAAVPPAALTFVALVDRAADYTDEALAGVGDWQTAKLIAITPGTFTEEADLGELDMGDPAVLTDFIARGIAGHPADHYALILWDHGSIAGVGSDESSGDGLTVPEIAGGARAGLDAAGVDRFDILGFDACLMGAYEVAATVASLADYMVASEEVEPNDGWDYSAFDLIAAQPDSVTASGLGQEIVARYVATSGPDDPTVTMSLLNLSKVGGLVTALDALDLAVVPEMATLAPAIGRGRNQAPSFGASPLPEEDFYMVDLGVMLQNLTGAGAPLADSAATALAALDEVVLASQAGEASSQATGLTIHFPPYAEYYYADWYRAVGAPIWADFLEAYYTAGTEIPDDKRPSFARVDNEASFFFDEYGLNVEATFNTGAVENIVDAVLYTGIPDDDGTVTFIGEDQGLYEGNQAVASNDLTQLQLFDGEDYAYAYQDISFSEDLNLFYLDVPLAYYAPGATPGSSDYRDITLKLTYNVTTEEFTEGFYAADEFGTISEFQADPQGLLVPWMLTWQPDGTIEWVQTTDVGLWADLPNLLYSFPKLDPGTPVYAELYVFDYGGNSDFASLTTEVPAGEAPWAACANETWGFEISYPDGWYVWEPPTPDLACNYFDISPMEGLTADEAFDQAALTVEVYEGDSLAQTLAFLEENSPTVQDTTVAGMPAALYESGRGEWGFRAYVVLLQGAPEGPALVIAAWGNVDDALAARADRVAASLVLGG